MARLSRADLEAVLDFAGEVGALAREPQRADPWILERIVGLVHADEAAYSQYDRLHRIRQDSEFPGPAFEPTADELEIYRTQNPYTSYAKRIRNPFFSARRLTDVVDMRVFRRTELYELVGEGASVQMRMPGLSGTTWMFEVVRADVEFTARDILLLDVLRPWLMQYEEQRRLARLVEKLTAASIHSVVAAGLSQRENEVLDLVAEGASNAAIAERLWISPATAAKHLENIYLNLDVGSRTAALASTGRSFSTDSRVPD